MLFACDLCFINAFTAFAEFSSFKATILITISSILDGHFTFLNSINFIIFYFTFYFRAAGSKTFFWIRNGGRIKLVPFPVKKRVNRPNKISASYQASYLTFKLIVRSTK